MKCLIVVDNSNIFIEGQKFSAKTKGIVKSSPSERDICDPSWRINFGGLLREIAEGQEIISAILVGSRPPKSDSIWDAAKQNGFSVTVHDRNSQNEEKAVDTELVVQGTEIICTTPEPGILKILSGDRDFIPLVSVAHRRKWFVEMWAFSNAYNPGGEMARSVDGIKPLDNIFHKIGTYESPSWP